MQENCTLLSELLLVLSPDAQNVIRRENFLFYKKCNLICDESQLHLMEMLIILTQSLHESSSCINVNPFPQCIKCSLI